MVQSPESQLSWLDIINIKVSSVMIIGRMFPNNSLSGMVLLWFATFYFFSLSSNLAETIFTLFLANFYS